MTMRSEWPLRIGLGLMYLYSSIDIIRRPDEWTWALPEWFTGIVTAMMPVETFLRLHGGFELVLALGLLAWFLAPRIMRYIALLAALEMAGILILNGVNAVTFRDIGLLGGSITLFLLLRAQAKGNS